MQHRNDLRTLVHRRGDTFDRTRANVADGEDARATWLHQAAIAANLSAALQADCSTRFTGPAAGEE